MVALETLQRQTADNVPVQVLEVDVPHHAVSILFQTLLADEVGAFQLAAVTQGDVGQTKLTQLVVQTELVVVAVAVGVMQRTAHLPPWVDVPRGGQDIVVLPEIISGLVPQTAVCHTETACHIAVAVHHHIAVGIVGDGLVQGVVLAQAGLVHIFVVVDARRHAVGTIHD